MNSNNLFLNDTNLNMYVESNVPESLKLHDVENMFMGCSNLTSIDGLEFTHFSNINNLTVPSVETSYNAETLVSMYPEATLEVSGQNLKLYPPNNLFPMSPTSSIELKFASTVESVFYYGKYDMNNKPTVFFGKPVLQTNKLSQISNMSIAYSNNTNGLFATHTGINFGQLAIYNYVVGTRGGNGTYKNPYSQTNFSVCLFTSDQLSTPAAFSVNVDTAGVKKLDYAFAGRRNIHFLSGSLNTDYAQSMVGTFALEPWIPNQGINDSIIVGAVGEHHRTWYSNGTNASNMGYIDSFFYNTRAGVTSMTELGYGSFTLESFIGGYMSLFSNYNIPFIEDAVNLVYANGPNDSNTVYPTMNTANVKNFAYMFAGRRKLTGAKIPTLDLSSAQNVEGMFAQCSGLTTPPLPSDLPNVVKASSLYLGCSNFSGQFVLNLKQTSYCELEGLLEGCKNITQANISANIEGSTLEKAFMGCDKLTTVRMLGAATSTSPQTIAYMCARDANLSAWPTGLNTLKTSNGEGAFCYCTNIHDITSANFSNLVHGDNMFVGCTNIDNINTMNFGKLSSGNYMFYGCINITDIRGTNLSKLYRANYMFANTGISTISGVTLSNLVYANHMFAYCQQLSTISGASFANLQHANGMFYGCNKITSPLSASQAPNLTNVDYFYSNTNITTCPTWPANAKSMNHTFANCPKITTANNLPFETNKLSGAFYNCKGLTTVDTMNFNTTKTMWADSAFYNCTALTTVKTSTNVNFVYMNYMFYGCNALTNASVLNIVNMALRSAVSSTYKNMNNRNTRSPLYGTKFDKTYYTALQSALTANGWTF